MIALNIGCGTRKVKIEGCDSTVNIDLRPEVNPDLVADVFSLPYEPESIDYIYSAHFLEHFSVMDGRRILRQFHKLLKPGGKLWTVVPNLEYACVQILKDGAPDDTSADILYGHQEYTTNFHKNGFTKKSMRKYLEASGLWKVLSCEVISGGFEVESKCEKI